MDVTQFSAVTAAIGSIATLGISYLNYNRRNEFKRKLNADLSAKTRLKWIKDVRMVSANFAKAYRILKVRNAFPSSQTEKEMAYADLLETLYLLKLYFPTTDISTKIDIASEYRNIRIYNNPEDKGNDNKSTSDLIKESEEIHKKNMEKLTPLFDKKANTNKAKCMGALLDAFSESVIDIEVPAKVNWRYSDSSFDRNKIIDDYFRCIMQAISKYIFIEESKAKKGI